MDRRTRILFDLACKAREHAFAPLSRYRVGAAVLTAAGRRYAGCNVESVTYTNTTHAEMHAIDTAVAAGDQRIEAICIVTDNAAPGFPCALCRQKIVEFGPDATVIACTLKGKVAIKSIRDLYPEPFVLTSITPKTKRP